MRGFERINEPIFIIDGKEQNNALPTEKPVKSMSF